MTDLMDAYRALRNSWQMEWAGLPSVITGTLNWLTQDVQVPHRLEDTPFYGILMQAAALVEMTGAQMAENGFEPHYHNRLHTADTLVSMACLLRAQRQLSSRESFPLGKEEALCILTMLLHDYGHEGHINILPKKNEAKSVFLYTPHMKSMGLGTHDLDRMNAMVLSTDPMSLGDLHRKFKPRPPSARPLEINEMTILVTEADILASALPYPGLDLSRALSAEWSKLYKEKSVSLMTCEGRLGFLQSGAHFSSEAAKALGIPVLITSQKQLLQEQLARSNQ